VFIFLMIIAFFVQNPLEKFIENLDFLWEQQFSLGTYRKLSNIL